MIHLYISAYERFLKEADCLIDEAASSGKSIYVNFHSKGYTVVRSIDTDFRYRRGFMITIEPHIGEHGLDTALSKLRDKFGKSLSHFTTHHMINSQKEFDDKVVSLIRAKAAYRNAIDALTKVRRELTQLVGQSTRFEDWQNYSMDVAEMVKLQTVLAQNEQTLVLTLEGYQNQFCMLADQVWPFRHYAFFHNGRKYYVLFRNPTPLEEDDMLVEDDEGFVHGLDISWPDFAGRERV